VFSFISDDTIQYPDILSEMEKDISRNE